MKHALLGAAFCISALVIALNVSNRKILKQLSLASLEPSMELSPASLPWNETVRLTRSASAPARSVPDVGLPLQMPQTASEVVPLSSSVATLEVGQQMSELEAAALDGVFMYDPQSFLMYTSCDHQTIVERMRAKVKWTKGGIRRPATLKHNVDFFFVRALTEPRLQQRLQASDPSEAELFVVPVLCSQSHEALCGNHWQNMLQLRDFLMSSEWFHRRHGVDHFVMCDNPSAMYKLRSVPELMNLTVGRFEALFDDRWSPGKSKHDNKTISVGYTTMDGIGLCNDSASPALPLESRNLTLAAVMTVGGDERRNLYCEWRRVNISDRPADIKLLSPSRLQQKGCGADLADPETTYCDTFDLLRQARATISLHGETPSTDRLFNAFDSGTVVVVLESQLSDLLLTLPFVEFVPWREILLILPKKKRGRSLLRSVAELVSNYSVLQQHLDLMTKYRDDVLWHVNATRAHLHTLQAAKAEVKQALAFRAS